MKKKPTNEVPALAGFTSREVKSLSQLTDDFAEKQRRKHKSDGSNEILQDFLIAARMLIANYSDRSFSQSEIVTLTRYLDTDVSSLVCLFNLWCDDLQKHGRLKELLSINTLKNYAFQ